MRSFLISTVTVFFIFHCSVASVAVDIPEIPDAERQGLIALYKSTNGDHWKNHENWLGPLGSECRWHGVECAPDEQYTDKGQWHVYGIHLLENNLTGELPSELGALTRLSHIDLLDNNLTGNIPSEFDNFDKLEEFLLSRNHLSGNLPPKLLKRFDDGQIRFLGYAGQFSPIVQIEFDFNPAAIICGDYHAVLKSDGSAILKTKICRRKSENDRFTYWETKTGFLDRYTGDFDRLVRMIERFGFYEMESEYNKPITHGVYETITIKHLDGKTIAVKDYTDAGPMNLWFLKRAITGALFNVEWETVTRSKPEMN
jgi:Leucine Rich Repeat (LRR) protein